MNLRPLLFVIIVLSLLFETTLITFPFFFVAGVVFYFLFPNEKSFIVVLFLGLILDSVKAITPGSTSIALALSFIFIYFYRQAFELRDYRIVLSMLLLASFIYSSIFEYSNSLLVYIVFFISSALVYSYFTKTKLI